MGIFCPVCGYDNPIGLRSCARCAARLVHVCPLCGSDNPAGFRFCGQCGIGLATTQLKQAAVDGAQRQERKGERRAVAILFCDLSGFTSLSERLDPEDIYSLMDDLFTSFVEVVCHFGGAVDKFMGDGLMALFGASIAGEDDAERAVRTALGIQAALERSNQNIANRYATCLQARFGINAGDVVVGSFGNDPRTARTVIGDAVNVAARLEEAASPGAVLVSEGIYQATETTFEYIPMGDIALRGRSAPVRAYRLLEERARPGRPRDEQKLATPAIGRCNIERRRRDLRISPRVNTRGSVASSSASVGVAL